MEWAPEGAGSLPDARDAFFPAEDGIRDIGVTGVQTCALPILPEAWEGARDLDAEVRGFSRYHSCLMEPWDGPAGLVFTDGVGVGAALDRNGLRPLRYAICEDGFVVCSSEVGAVDVSGHGTVERGRLGPGEILFVDPTRGVQHNDDVKERLAAGGTYSHWAHDGFLNFGPGEPVQQTPESEDIEARQALHGYTQ